MNKNTKIEPNVYKNKIMVSLMSHILSSKNLFFHAEISLYPTFPYIYIYRVDNCRLIVVCMENILVNNNIRINSVFCLLVTINLLLPYPVLAPYDVPHSALQFTLPCNAQQQLSRVPSVESLYLRLPDLSTFLQNNGFNYFIQIVVAILVIS